MKHYILFIIFSTILNSNAQDSLKNISNGLLNYSFPNNWTESPYQKINNNVTYGCQVFDIGETGQFSVIEVINDSKNNNTLNLQNEEIKNLVFNLFSPTSEFLLIEDSMVANLNSKFVKANAITSKGLKLTTIMHLTYFKNKILIIQGIYTTNNEKEYLPTIIEIIKSIKTL